MTDEPSPRRKSRSTLPDRVRDLLLRGLFSEVYLAGDRRPDEDELAARFEVSPATIPGGSSRARRGRLPRAAHGTGTLVTAITRSRHTLNANSSYKAMLRKLVPPATAEEAAASLGMSLDTFERRVQPVIKLVPCGQLVLVPLRELERWCDDHAHYLAGVV